MPGRRRAETFAACNPPGFSWVRPLPPNSESTVGRIVDIRVDDAPNPFVELRRLLTLALPRAR